MQKFAGDAGMIPGLGRSPGGGHGKSCLENPMEREPGGLQSPGLQGVGHWSDLALMHKVLNTKQLRVFRAS